MECTLKVGACLAHWYSWLDDYCSHCRRPGTVWARRARRAAGPHPPPRAAIALSIAISASLTAYQGVMRPVLHFPPLTDAGLAAPMELSGPSSPAEDLVFPFDAEGSQRTPLPYEQSAAAAFEAIRQLEATLEPTGDAQLMVSVN